jgi:hypothetical protein
MPRPVLAAVAALGALALAALAPSARADESLRCNGRIVSVGDSKLDLLGRCGRPTLAETRAVERARFVAEGDRHAGATAIGAGEVTTVDAWTYDPGPNEFVHVVTLEGGRITAIERASYGYAKDPARAPASLPVARCESRVIRVGDRTLDLLARCGDPATVDRRRERRAVAFQAAGLTAGEFVSVELEVWAYNFGPNRFTALVTIEDGKVISVDRGSYGY